MKLSCRTGPLRVGRAFARLFNWSCRFVLLLLPLVGIIFLVIGTHSSVIASEAVDEAAVPFVGALGGGGCGPGDGAEEFALFGSFEASFFAGFGFAVERLGYCGGASLLA